MVDDEEVLVVVVEVCTVAGRVARCWMTPVSVLSSFSAICCKLAISVLAAVAALICSGVARAVLWSRWYLLRVLAARVCNCTR